MDSSEREEKLRHNLGQMKARFTEVKNTVNAEGEQSASGSQSETEIIVIVGVFCNKLSHTEIFTIEWLISSDLVQET